jgi:hypothetical protein
MAVTVIFLIRFPVMALPSFGAAPWHERSD